MTTGKTIALTRQTVVGKVMSVLFNMLSRLIITFLPRSKRLLILWLQSLSAVILEPKKLCWSSREELPHVQGKRNPGKTVGVARGHQRADTPKPQSQETSQSDHRTTALSNSMELSHAVWGHPRWPGHGGEVWQNVVHRRREWQTTSAFLPWEPQEQYEQ